MRDAGGSRSDMRTFGKAPKSVHSFSPYGGLFRFIDKTNEQLLSGHMGSKAMSCRRAGPVH
jgi:hypothetical protein